MEENVIQFSGGIMINVDASVKNAMYVKKMMFGILLHVVVRMGNNSAITCDEIIESNNEETKFIPTNFNEKKATCKISMFYLHFY